MKMHTGKRMNAVILKASWDPRFQDIRQGVQHNLTRSSPLTSRHVVGSTHGFDQDGCASASK